MEMFVQHCSFVPCSLAIMPNTSVHVCINTSLGCLFTSNIRGGESTYFPALDSLGVYVQGYSILHDALRFGHYEQSFGTSMTLMVHI